MYRRQAARPGSSMGPVLSEINDTALQPYLHGDLNASAAMSAGLEPLRDFMARSRNSPDRNMGGEKAQSWN